MRSWLLAAVLAASCGGEAGTNPLDLDGGVDTPECMPCADRLRSDTAPCGATLDHCTNDPTLSVEQQIACFQADGRCYSSALLVASACHHACGDEPQSKIESCAAACFTDRAACAERALRRADACFDSCGDPNQCALCDQLGQSDFDACDATLVDCANACMQTYRGG